ncbi:hypothetical protein BD289DRAFT_437166 [Coniella lustricola]|uniref:NAD(P)-binding domain-containing protein n=1 Tax=Coniella lustricola TaxID=2025994 RepID=A0A2T3A486_9PEZI|nr:hypothetical protein BD289DRAFT_437166 [Coniella lustricola]
MSKRYVLTGVGGGIGSTAADYVLSIRDPATQHIVLSTTSFAKLPADKLATWRSAPNSSVVEASYEDVASLTAIFRGAEAIAWVSTWAIFHRPQQAANVLAAAKEAGVGRVVYSSFVGAGLGVDTPEAAQKDVRKELPFLPQDHALTERLIRASGLDWNVQRNYLYQDITAAFFSGAWKFCGDKWLNNSGGKAAAYVAREDCGRVFGALLLGKGEVNKAYYVSGPERVTDRDMFEWMNARSGYQAEFVDMEDEALRSWWAERGMTTDALEMLQSELPLKLCQEDLLCCGQMVRWGYLDQVHDTVELLTGKKAVRFQDNFVKYEFLFPKNDPQ